MQHTATHSNTQQNTTTHCNTLQHTSTHCNTLQHTATHCNTLNQYRVALVRMFIDMGWLRSVGSIKLVVSFAAYRLFYRALLQKRPIILSILLTEATLYVVRYNSVWYVHMCICTNVCVCVYVHLYRCIYMYIYIYIYENIYIYIYIYKNIYIYIYIYENICIYLNLTNLHMCYVCDIYYLI